MCFASVVLFHRWCPSICCKLIFLCRASFALSTIVQSHFAISNLHVSVVTLLQICFLSQRKAQRSFQHNGYGSYCVRVNHWKDEPMSSEDCHEMPWVQLMFICAQHGNDDQNGDVTFTPNQMFTCIIFPQLHGSMWNQRDGTDGKITVYWFHAALQ